MVAEDLPWRDRKVHVVYMSGNGGNKAVRPRLDVAFAITSNNYGAKGMHEQTARAGAVRARRVRP